MELDMFDNSILSVRRDEDGRKVWEVASHVLLPHLGLKRISVAVAVANETLDLTLSDCELHMCDVSHVFQVRYSFGQWTVLCCDECASRWACERCHRGTLDLGLYHGQ